ncbi:MAG: CoA transferase [Betaproteobacteria bacterium]|nr:CoA transferase [Betaproteobacteria bacterium]
MKPLAGIRVLDFTRIYAGPYCTMLLGDHGADVVKVEMPGGDPVRSQGPPFHHGMGMTFLAANRNKRSIVLDVKKPDDLERLRCLAGRADVIVENFRPEVMPRLGLGYEELAQSNPGLVYASLSGLGADGPDADKGAFDLTVQAIGGFMSITGERGGRPIKVGTSIFDLVCGLNAYSAIAVSLYRRQLCGLGQRVETSLLEGEVAFLVDAGLEYLVSGHVRERWGSEHSQIVPYKVFDTKDGMVVIGAGYESVFKPFLEVIGRLDLLDDPRFATLAARVEHRDAVYGVLDAEVRKHGTQDLVARMEAAKVPCSHVNDMRQVFDHPQVLHRGMRMNLEHPVYGSVPTLGPAVKYSGFEVTDGWSAPPMLDEHAHQIMADWLPASTPAGASGIPS